ncbi:helix-turn-helix domain-containing protein [Brevundimonas sp. Root1423]|uniref:helix-turn-helix domain-containing protein n=1 Tax=Brevundimonas sp. Root1423 TaxID=1736462 RepID=UPI000ACE7CC1|nr:helix-turn-helix domain-containing protein [Brevundimonas sp. Root1423]
MADAGRSGFSSQTHAHLFGPSIIARARSSAQTLAREADHIRRSGIDHISVIVNLIDTIGDCDGQTLRAEAGSVQFRDLSRPSLAAMPGIDMVTVMVPRASVPGWLLARGIHGLVLPGSSAGGRLVASHLLTMTDVADQLSDAEGAAGIEAAFVIAERFLGHQRSVTPGHADAIHRTIRERAMALLDSRPPDSKWSAATLAIAIGVSRTSLYRAFESTGGVRTYVLRRRLARTYIALRGRRGLSPSVELIGQRNGFPDRRTFVQAFKAQFGMSPDDVAPSELRSDAVAGREAASARAMHDVLADWIRMGEAA